MSGIPSQPASPTDIRERLKQEKPNKLDTDVDHTKNNASKLPSPRRSRRSGISLLEWGTLVLGTIGVIGTFIFGAWAIKSYNATELANNYASQSLTAAQDPGVHNAITLTNQLMQLNAQLLLHLLCSSTSTSQNESACSAVSSELPLVQIATSLGVYPGSSTLTATPEPNPALATGTPGNSTFARHSLSLGAIIGILVPALLSAAALIFYLIYRRVQMTRRSTIEY